MKLIPLRNRAGEIIAHAKVDNADFDELNQYRWHRSRYGYAARSVWTNGRTVHHLMHRVLLGLAHGDPREGDHENRDRLDNRRSNLRPLAPGRNAQNQSARGRSAHRGVCWHKGKSKWMAYSYVDRKVKWLGYFDDERAAAQAARDFRREHMPYAVEDVAA